jgi:hypothetical protein
MRRNAKWVETLERTFMHHNVSTHGFCESSAYMAQISIFHHIFGCSDYPVSRYTTVIMYLFSVQIELWWSSGNNDRTIVLKSQEPTWKESTTKDENGMLEEILQS